MMAVLGAPMNPAKAENGELPLGMAVDHLNLVLSVAEAEPVHKFYGEILGLKRIPDINFPGDDYMIRYMGGDTEVKFIVTKRNLPAHEGGTRAARGIRMFALLLPEAEREGILSRMKAAEVPIPEFTSGKNEAAGYSYAYGMVYDYEGNQVEIVFLSENTPADKFRQLQIGLTVSDMAAMDAFLTDVMGYHPVVTEGRIHRYNAGVSQVKFWEGGKDLPAWVGGPMEIRGMTLVQHIVRDVDAVRTTVLERGGKIHTEPFPLGQLATIMFVEGPDGILFEFAGPLLEQFKK